MPSPRQPTPPREEEDEWRELPLPSQPKRHRQRKPSLTRLIAKAKQLGVDVRRTQWHGDVPYRQLGTAESMTNEWDEVLPHHGKH